MRAWECVFCVYACEHVCACDSVLCVTCICMDMNCVCMRVYVHACEHVCCVCMHVNMCVRACKIFCQSLTLLYFSFLFHRQIDVLHSWPLFCLFSVIPCLGYSPTFPLHPWNSSGQSTWHTSANIFSSFFSFHCTSLFPFFFVLINCSSVNFPGETYTNFYSFQIEHHDRSNN